MKIRPTKPYQICQWVGDKQTPHPRLVQTISRPIPGDTIKVRMVPGDPTTMRELPIAELEVSSSFSGKKSLKVHIANVRGVGCFPVDMLRYDWAALVDPDIQVHNSEGDIILRGKEPIQVYRLSCRGHDSGWTVDRWWSFLWSVKPIHSLAIDAME